MVTRQYLNVCKQHGYDVSKVILGNCLDITRAYYQAAVEITYEMGMKLAQVVWRKLMPSETDEANRTLNSLSYNLIAGRKYSTASAMLKFGLIDIKSKLKDTDKKQMVVNYANAEKLLENKAASLRIIDGEDWSATTIEYRICVAGVKDDIDFAIENMKFAVETGALELDNFRDWPVFQTMRTVPRFIDAFETTFNEKILLDREAFSMGAAESKEAVVTSINGPENEIPEEPSTIH